MGCGASSESGDRPQADAKHQHDENVVADKDLNDLIAAPMAKRMESKYPWEDMEPIPEDTTVVFILGGPGSGKSTQCKKLVELMGYTHLVTGDLLRQEVDSGTAMGKWASDLMAAGKLVPNQLSITLLKKAMIRANNPMVLIDGFPRSLDQVHLCEKGISKAHAVIFFEVPEELARERRITSGGNAEDFKSVYNTFKDQSLPVKQHFVAAGKCHVLDASQHPDAIFEQVKVIFQDLEARRKEELDEMARIDQARREAEAAGEYEEEEEEDASYDIAVKVPASHYNAPAAAEVEA